VWRNKYIACRQWVEAKKTKYRGSKTATEQWTVHGCEVVERGRNAEKAGQNKGKESTIQPRPNTGRKESGRNANKKATATFDFQ